MRLEKSITDKSLVEFHQDCFYWVYSNLVEEHLVDYMYISVVFVNYNLN